VTRTLTAGMQTAVAAQRGTYVQLLQIDSSAGSNYISTSPVDITWNSHTWDALGGAILIGAAEEAPDASAGLELSLSGVDQTIIAMLMSTQVRGYEIRMWLAHIADDGTVISDPLECFRGYQLSDYTITERRPVPPARGTVDVRTRVVSRMTPMNRAQPVRSNIVSHRDMLKRAGLAVTDTFMQNVASVAGRPIFWNSTMPLNTSGGGDDQRRSTS
jgi:hypothetical protein